MFPSWCKCGDADRPPRSGSSQEEGNEGAVKPARAPEGGVSAALTHRHDRPRVFPTCADLVAAYIGRKLGRLRPLL